MVALPYASRGQQERRRTAALLSSVFVDFRGWYMQRRPDWNRMGPHLPLWFKLALKRVDHRLCLQFIPPSSVTGEKGGLPSNWKHGAWYICAKIPHSKWIARRAVFVLVDHNGELIPPDREIIKVLRHARKMRRQNDLDSLDRMYEDSVDRLMRERSDESRAQLLENVVQTMRQRNMMSRANPHVFIPAPRVA